MTFTPDQIKKIAIFRALQLGDILCSIPAIRALRLAYPQAHITFIGLPGTRKLIERFSHYIDEFLPFPGYYGLPEQTFEIKELEQFESQITLRKFDLILQMQGNGSIVNHMISLWGARFTAGFCQFEGLENESFLTYPNYGHESQRHMSLMEHLGIRVENRAMEFPVFQRDEETLKQLVLPIEPLKYICIHPGSRGGWRQWPPQLFAEIGNLCSSHGFVIVLTGTQEELGIVNQVADLLQEEPVVAAGKTALGELAVLLNQAYGLISNCTGVSHMAAALKTPSVVISMDGEPERWAPVNKTLHRTIDWITNPDYALVENAVLDLLEGSIDRTASSTSAALGTGMTSV